MTLFFKVFQVSFRMWSNFKLLKSLHSVQNRIFGNHWQISEIITPESIVGLMHMSNHRKAEKVSYNICIEGFLRWYSN
jgi:hypothetical protein